MSQLGMVVEFDQIKNIFIETFIGITKNASVKSKIEALNKLHRGAEEIH
jgi:hypothetical protein